MSTKLSSAERTQIAYLANALVHHPEQSSEFLCIFAQEGEGSSNIQDVVAALQKSLKGPKVTVDVLRNVAKTLAQKNGAVRYAGQALAGSLEGKAFNDES